MKTVNYKINLPGFDLDGVDMSLDDDLKWFQKPIDTLSDRDSLCVQICISENGELRDKFTGVWPKWGWYEFI